MPAKRLNKYLAEHGVASRRGADALIDAGRITINGRTATLGDKVADADTVAVDGKPLDATEPERRYILLHKPVGIITTTDTRKPDNVIDLIGIKERVFPVGRLDVESSGLLLLTNDGELANRLMHPRYGKEKTYEVEVDRAISGRDLGAWRAGIMLEDGKTLPAEVRKLDDTRFEITLREGRNRQIRRMCEAREYGVVSLTRTKLGPLALKGLKPGAWRELKDREVRKLYE